MNKAKVTGKKVLSHDVFELHFETAEPFNFEAGQFITIKICDTDPKPCFRAYSISSAPSGNTFELCIKEIPNGRGSCWLNTLTPGAEIEFIGPNGKFNFTTDSTKKVLFIATGTGVAPLKSMIEDQLNKDSTQPMHLLFGVRHIKDIFFKEHFEKISNDNFSFDLALSQPEDESWEGSIGRVTDHIPDTKNTEVYICGLKGMIDSVHKILLKKGLSENSIHHEKYD
jgi:ferredoxin-NADP reductase